MGSHWRASCIINAILLGDRTMPLCSRVFAMPPSWWRAHYLRAMDVLFSEEHHCLYIHLRWITAKHLGDRHENE